MKIKAVFVGFCQLESKKPGAVVRLLDEGNQLGREIIFPRKSMQHSNIGGVYEIEQVTETSFGLAGRQYLGMFSNAPQVAEWQLLAKADQLREETSKMEAKDKSLPVALNMLAPLRETYKRALPDRRRAIEILLLDYLRR